ncbi:MAG: tetratricopeptide repeat protein [Gammaproteobacteria bacterium]|nr:tetratricopeptide repeat protein [Gammaproteobacteria bacterium]
MATNEHDELQALKAWWNENWLFITVGLFISVGSVVGYRMWEARQLELTEQASNVFEAASEAALDGDLETLAARTGTLESDYAGTPYAAQAALLHAAKLVENGELQAAAGKLRWAMNNSDDPELALLARLRLARVMLMTDQAADATSLLTAVEAGAYDALYQETLGDAALLQGDREQARAHYSEALALLDGDAVGDRQMVEMKLQNVEMPMSALDTASAADEPADATAESGDDSQAGE